MSRRSLCRRNLRRRISPDALAIIKEICSILSGQFVGQALSHQDEKTPGSKRFSVANLDVPFDEPNAQGTDSSISGFKQPSIADLDDTSAKAPFNESSAQWIDSLVVSTPVDRNGPVFCAPPLLTLPLEILHLISNILDVRSLCRLTRVCQYLNQSLVGILHRQCGLKVSHDSIHLKARSHCTEDGDPDIGLIMFKAFRSFHRVTPSKWITATFFENVEESIEDFLFGLSFMVPGSVQTLNTAFLRPLASSNNGLLDILCTARRLRIESLLITYPFLTQRHTFDTPLETSYLRLRVDLNEPFYWDLLRSAADCLKELALIHDSPCSWETPETTNAKIGFATLCTLRFQCLVALTISIDVPPDVLAEFIHHHQTLAKLEVVCFDHLLAKMSTPATRRYSYSIKNLTGPANYLNALLDLSDAPLELDWLRPTLCGLSGTGDWHQFEETIRCISRCEHVRALAVYLPESRYQTWLPKSDKNIQISRVSRTVKTLRLVASESGITLSNDEIMGTFAFWRKHFSEASDLQYMELWQNEGRKELVQAIEVGGCLKVSVKSGGSIYENQSTIERYGELWWF